MSRCEVCRKFYPKDILECPHCAKKRSIEG